MGLAVLHSGHHSKPFKRLMGTSCPTCSGATTRPRRLDRRPRPPDHRRRAAPCSDPGAGICSASSSTPAATEQLIFISSFGGWRGVPLGLLLDPRPRPHLLFLPGHQEHPVYFQPEVQRVLINASVGCALPLGGLRRAGTCQEMGPAVDFAAAALTSRPVSDSAKLAGPQRPFSCHPPEERLAPCAPACHAAVMAKQRNLVQRSALRLTGVDLRGPLPGLRGPSAMAPVAIAALAVGAAAIGRLAISARRRSSTPRPSDQA